MRKKKLTVYDFESLDPFEYPGEIPDYSFLLEGARIFKLSVASNRPLKASLLKMEFFLKELDEYLLSKSLSQISERKPIIVYGSLRNPPSLYDRFNSDASKNEYIQRAHIKNTYGTDLVPSFHCVLTDYDVVYMAHASKRGYIPITLAHSPGTVLPILVIFLDERQLKMMDIGEGRDRDFYKLIKLYSKGVILENGEILREAYVYANTNRVLGINEKLVRPKNVLVKNPRFQSKTQEEVLGYILRHEPIQEISESNTPQELSRSFFDETRILPKINQYLHSTLSTSIEPLGVEIPFEGIP